MVTIQRDVAYTQGKNCRFCLHVFSVAFYFGRSGNGPRLEIFTPMRKFRWTPGE